MRDKRKDKLPPDVKQFVDDLFQELCIAEDDLGYANGVIEGTWPDADNHIRKRREKLMTEKEKKAIPGEHAIALACAFIPNTDDKKFVSTPGYVFQHNKDQVLQIKNEIIRAKSLASLRQEVHNQIDKIFFTLDKFSDMIARDK